MLKGRVTIKSNGIIATLPKRHRPAREVFIPIVCYRGNGENLNVCVVRIDSSGSIKAERNYRIDDVLVFDSIFVDLIV